MSRTDRHRPAWVQAADPYEKRKSKEVDEWDYPVFYFRNCNCRTWYCCLSSWTRRERRQARHEAQRLCRKAVKGSWE
jgi:hypothetical protein